MTEALTKKEWQPMEQSTPIAITPMGMLQIAVSKGADLAQLEKLMELQERWERNEARKAYQIAFAAFKSEAVVVVKNIDITAGPLSGKKYADLFGVVDSATHALSSHGLTSNWKITKDEKDWIEVTCSITHVAGHSESASFGGPPDSGGAKNAIQARASTLTYLQRYTFLAVTGLAAGGTDDDGNQGKQKITPTAGAADNVTVERQKELKAIADDVRELIASGHISNAVASIELVGMDSEDKIYMWTLFDSAERSAIKKESKRQKDAATKAAMDAAISKAKETKISDAQKKRLEARIGELSLDRDNVKKYCSEQYGVDHFADLTQHDYNDLDLTLESMAGK